eukprot:2704243-Pyramimonas_sp.AAC.1
MVSVWIHPRDDIGNPQDYVLAGADAFALTLTGPARVPPPRVYRLFDGDGLAYYYAEFAPTVSGVYAVGGMLTNRAHASQTALAAIGTVMVLTGAASRKFTRATGAGLTRAFAAEPSGFAVSLFDEHANAIVDTVGGYEVAFQLDNRQRAEFSIAPTSLTLKEETSFPYFEARYATSAAGTYDVRVVVRRAPGAGAAGAGAAFVPFEVALGSDVPLVVSAGALSVNRSSASGPGLVSPVPAAVPVGFVIRTSDAYGNPLGRGGLALDVVMLAANPETTGGSSFRVSDVVDRGDGTYVVNYTANVAGRYYVQIYRGGGGEHL